MGGAVVIPVIMQIHTDFLCPFQTPDRTLTRRNQMLRDDDIFSKVEQKNKQTKTDFPFYSPLARTRDKRILWFSEFNWKIVFSKITSRISKPLSVFEKLGLGSKYRGEEQRFSTQSGKKNATSQGMPKLNHSGDRHPQPGGKKEGTVN